MRRLVVLGALMATGALTLAAAPRSSVQEPGSVTIQTMDVRENLYVISGGGGHTAALVTEQHGVVLVDTKLAGWGQSILQAIQAITDQPVTVIINTHSHGDHVGGNADFPNTVEIIAQESTAANMSRMDAFTGPGAAFLPDRTFGATLTLFDGRDQIDLYYFGAGHTDRLCSEPPSSASGHRGAPTGARPVPLSDERPEVAFYPRVVVPG